MKKQLNDITRLAQLSVSIGDFISYWGFRSIHGQIWTQVYLSRNPLSGADLTGRLSVSKALVSPALAELEKYGLIKSQYVNKKTKVYYPETQIMPVIKKILKNRELKIIDKAHEDLLNLLASIQTNSSHVIHFDRAIKIEKMILMAQFAVKLLIETDIMAEYE